MKMRRHQGFCSSQACGWVAQSDICGNLSWLLRGGVPAPLMVVAALGVTVDQKKSLGGVGGGRQSRCDWPKPRGSNYLIFPSLRPVHASALAVLNSHCMHAIGATDAGTRQRRRNKTAPSVNVDNLQQTTSSVPAKADMMPVCRTWLCTCAGWELKMGEGLPVAESS